MAANSQAHPETFRGQFRQKHGTCRKQVDGKECGKPWTGSAARLYCDEHSVYVKRVGRGA